uniref:Uncharacterized protein n=1 Tax=Candidatus Kentrum sp. FW TaxID=2126338 RepID=A0A450T2Q6_9GAMM|nr:MAG: hypothetical protein BECKFW1821B_GA0114236_106010 [Candidatus Kentron sp. FW]
MDRFVRICRANFQALFRYHPSPWEGKIVLFLVRERIRRGGEGLESGWRGFARGIERHTISGDQFTMYRQPNVYGITKVLKSLP